MLLARGKENQLPFQASNRRSPKHAEYLQPLALAKPHRHKQRIRLRPHGGAARCRLEKPPNPAAVEDDLRLLKLKLASTNVRASKAHDLPPLIIRPGSRPGSQSSLTPPPPSPSSASFPSTDSSSPSNGSSLAPLNNGFGERPLSRRAETPASKVVPPLRANNPPFPAAAANAATGGQSDPRPMRKKAEGLVGERRHSGDFLLPVRVGTLSFVNDEGTKDGFLAFDEVRTVDSKMFGKIDGASPRDSPKAVKVPRKHRHNSSNNNNNNNNSGEGGKVVAVAVPSTSSSHLQKLMMKKKNGRQQALSTTMPALVPAKGAPTKEYRRDMQEAAAAGRGGGGAEGPRQLAQTFANIDLGGPRLR